MLGPLYSFGDGPLWLRFLFPTSPPHITTPVTAFGRRCTPWCTGALPGLVFGCSFWVWCLVLLDKDDRCKFKARCALLIFLHYATSHPLYTYAFVSPRSKRVLYRQDAIFLVTTFPMRSARANSGLPTDGEPLVAVRSPLALDSQDDSTFQQWKAGDALPDFDDHVTGESMVDDPNFACADTPDVPPDWPRRYPYHPSFGSPSTVPVPVPTLFPSPSLETIPTAPPVTFDSDFSASWDARASRDLGDGASSFSDADDDMRASTADASALEMPVPYSIQDRDKDLSRGMGHHLRWPLPPPASAVTPTPHQCRPLRSPLL
jgi:hypothetical protein